MAINKNLIHFNEKTKFEEKLANNEILDTSIVFIKDSKEIWTHGQLYGGGSMVNITHADLVELRDNACLIPGMQYRITDYVTTTNQADTKSAGHQFDIIITADSENTLNEKARAIQHDGDTYFADSNLAAWKLWYCLDNDTSRFAWANTKIIESAVETIIADSSECTIKSDLIDGNTFITPFNFESCVWVDADEKNSGYTTADNHDIDELVYEWNYFDNPKTGNTELCIYKSDADIYEEEGCADSGDKYVYRGLVIVDGKEYDYWQKYESNQDGEYDELTIAGDGYVYATTPRIVSNPEAYSYEIFTLESKGIIYRMIDEFNNDCPYDFKNIKFYHNGFETDVYTFTWIDENYNVMDTSVFGNNGTLTYYGEIYGVYGNVIKPYMEIIYDEDSGDCIGTKQSLNNTTFISDYEYEGSGNDGFYGCYSNSFSNDCHHNSFSNDCYYNSFGNECSSNSFGNSCNHNSFDNSCYNNSFGDNCSSNSFGINCNYNNFSNNCNHNNFSNNCESNSFGNNCNDNSFGNGCINNSLGDGCNYNSFDNNCYYNSFAEACSHNSFADSCNYNSFGNYCHYNSFGNKCNYNSFGNNCESNSFGNNCIYNSFRLSASTTATILDYCQCNHFDDGCIYNVIWNDVQPTSRNALQNINVVRGVSGKSSAYNYINIVDKNAAYEIKVAKNSKGEIKIYCEADLIV